MNIPKAFILQHCHSYQRTTANSQERVVQNRPYARDLRPFHLGIAIRYTQQDLVELMRCWTAITVLDKRRKTVQNN